MCFEPVGGYQIGEQLIGVHGILMGCHWEAEEYPSDEPLLD